MPGRGIRGCERQTLIHARAARNPESPSPAPHSYAAVLARVAKGTDDPKLRRFAMLPIEKTDDVPAASYVPGTISLVAQRAKYPSLYPESTYQSGRL